MAKQVEHLESGYVRVRKGQQQWVNSKGQTTDAEHYYNVLTGATLSIRQGQNIQREARAEQGQPKAPTIHRQGKINTKAVGTSELHGVTQSFVFYNLEDLITFAENVGIAPRNFALIQMRYKEWVGTGAQEGGSEKKKNVKYFNKKGEERYRTQQYGYATLSGYISRQDFENGDVDWEEIIAKYRNYTLGTNGRVYLYAVDK